jgi:hypothetical protein
MGHAVPTPSEMFSDTTDPVQVASRFEQYKGTLTNEHQKAANGGRAFVPGTGIVEDPAAKSRAIAERVENLTKGLGTDVVTSVQGEIDAIKSALSAEIGKDWSLPGTGANNATLVPYDLEAPAKLLVPRLTPLRNQIPRGKGQGTARQFRRILGWSNAGIGGVADKSPFFDSQVDPGTTFGSLQLRRGAKIEYASDNKSAAYVEMSLSDQVNWVAQYAGQGFDDIRSLSQTALLWAHLGGEERAMLYGRGSSGSGYAGSVAAPTCTATGIPNADGIVGSIPAGTYKVVVTAKTGFGETAVSATVDGVATSTNKSLKIAVTSQPVGSLGVYNVYVSAVGAADASAATFQTTFVGTTHTLTSLSTTGRTAPAADTSVQTLGYDGFLTVQSDPAQSGYFKNLDDQLTTANPGTEVQDALLALYTSVKADPDHIWVDGGTAKQLGDLLKVANSSSYRLQLNGDGHGHFLGSVVTGIENQVTRKMLPFNVHPWMPQGCMLIRSETLPVPDSHVSATAEVISVQEYMSVDWPVVQMTWDASTYWYGTLVHYAPAWSGLICGITTR